MTEPSRRFQVVRSEDGMGLPPLDQEQGTSYGWFERLFLSWQNGEVFDYGDWHARDIEDMLTKSDKARQLEQVLCGPIEACEWSIKPAKGDSGEAEWLQAFLDADQWTGGMQTPMDLVLAQATSAIPYCKAFFELVWTRGRGDFEGNIVYSKVAYRPASTCRAVRDGSGSLLGFNQEAYYTGPGISKGIEPIEVRNRPNKAPLAWVHIHGTRRDPINGVSDMDVPYWAYKTKQKVLFLWLQFAEQASLPRLLVKAQELGVAQQVAGQIAKLKNSGVLPVAAPQGPQSVDVQTLDISGKGGDQFLAILNYLDQAAVNANLAGFLNLTNIEKSGGGWSLSKDASDFYLQRLEGKTREQERSARAGVFAPLVRLNHGPTAKVPILKYEPLNAEDKSDQVTMLTDLMRSRDPALVPDEFIGELAQSVADYLGMDGGKIRKAFDDTAAKARAAAAAAGQPPAGQGVAAVAGTVNQAAGMVARATRPRGQTIPGITGPQLPAAY